VPASIRTRAAPRRHAAPAPLLSTRALNRALLARQLLLRRVRLAPEAALTRLCGLQSQNPPSAYVALWSRLAGFDPERLSALLVARRAARIALLRSTVHLVTARDALALRPLVQARLDRELGAVERTRALRGVDRGKLVAVAEEALRSGPLTAEALRAALVARFPSRDPAALLRAVRSLLPLVQVPPRGLWGQGGQVRLAHASAWLLAAAALEANDAAAAAPPAPSLDDLLVRYLAAFGPASPVDAQTWSGLTGLAEAFARLRPRLRTFRDEHGRELLDLPRAPRPDPATHAPVRFLPDYDNALLSHVDRRRIVCDPHRRVLARPNGALPGTVLVDGFVRATWRVERDGPRATLAVKPLEDLSREELAEVKDEGLRLVGFLAGGATVRSVRVDG
jgi:hypothetical protein